MYLNTESMKFQCENVYELNYAVLNAIGLSCPNGYLVDQDTHLPLTMFDKRIKAMIDPSQPVYAGEGEMMIDLIHNLKLVTYLLGYYLEKKAAIENMPVLTQFTETILDSPMTALTVKFSPQSQITTDYFYNKCLKFVHMIFKIEDNMDIDLHNFDNEESPL